MLGFIVTVGILSVLFWIGFKITGALFKAFIWLFILLPIAICIWGLGLLCCCTIILIPIGTKLFKAGSSILF